LVLLFLLRKRKTCKNTIRRNLRLFCFVIIFVSLLLCCWLCSAKNTNYLKTLLFAHFYIYFFFAGYYTFQLLLFVFKFTLTETHTHSYIYTNTQSRTHGGNRFFLFFFLHLLNNRRRSFLLLFFLLHIFNRTFVFQFVVNFISNSKHTHTYR